MKGRPEEPREEAETLCPGKEYRTA